MNDSAEQERLFLYGYGQGRAFIEALQRHKVEREDVSAEVPLILLMLLQGPTPDFMLGRIFEVAQEHALEKILSAGGRSHPDEVQQGLALAEYGRKNCRLVGNSN